MEKTLLKKRVISRLKALNYNYIFNAKTEEKFVIDIFCLDSKNKKYAIMLVNKPTNNKINIIINKLKKYVDIIIFATFSEIDNITNKNVKIWKFSEKDIVNKVFEVSCNNCSRIFYTTTSLVKCCPYCKSGLFSIIYKEDVYDIFKDINYKKANDLIILKNPKLFTYNGKIYRV